MKDEIRELILKSLEPFGFLRGETLRDFILAFLFRNGFGHPGRLPNRRGSNALFLSLDFSSRSESKAFPANMDLTYFPLFFESGGGHCLESLSVGDESSIPASFRSLSIHSWHRPCVNCASVFSMR